MALLEVNGKKINVADLNPRGGNPLILIHGLFTNLSLYYFTIAPRLAESRRVVLYDMRGHGLSGQRDEGYTLEIMTGDLLDLMSALEISRAALTGYSYGGDIALYAALRHPALVERLALIEAPALNEEAFMEPLSHESDAAMDLIIENYSRSMGITVSEGKSRRMKEMSRSLLGGGKLPAALKQGRRELEELPLEQQEIPALLLYGGQSPLLQTGQGFARRLPRAELHVTGGDHNLPVQQHAWVLEKLESFFSPED